MNNFAEELTYWYFRLNGFFLLTNYVLHDVGQGQQRGTADADLLVIRFPYVYEEIGGQSKDWDKEKFSTWGFDIEKDYNDTRKLDRQKGKNKLEYSYE